MATGGAPNVSDDTGLPRRNVAKALAFEAVRTFDTLMAASGALRAAGTQALADLTEEVSSGAPSNPALETTASPDPAARLLPAGGFEILDRRAEPGSLTYLAIGTGADLARALREHEIASGPLLGPLAPWALAGTLSTIAGMDADAVDQSIRATEQLLLTTRPSSASLEQAIAGSARLRAEHRGDPRSLLTALNEYGQNLAENLDLSNLALEAALRAKASESSDAGYLMHGPWSYPSSGGQHFLRSLFAEATPARAAYLTEGQPWNEGALVVAWSGGEWANRTFLIHDTDPGLLIETGDVKAVLLMAERVEPDGGVLAAGGSLALALLADSFGIPCHVAMPRILDERHLSPGERSAVRPSLTLDRRSRLRQMAEAGVSDTIPRQLIASVLR